MICVFFFAVTVGKELRSKAAAGESIQMSRVRSRTAGVSVSVVCNKFSTKEPSFRSSSIFCLFLFTISSSSFALTRFAFQ